MQLLSDDETMMISDEPKNCRSEAFSRTKCCRGAFDFIIKLRLRGTANMNRVCSCVASNYFVYSSTSDSFVISFAFFVFAGFCLDLAKHEVARRKEKERRNTLTRGGTNPFSPGLVLGYYWLPQFRSVTKFLDTSANPFFSCEHLCLLKENDLYITFEFEFRNILVSMTSTLHLDRHRPSRDIVMEPHWRLADGGTSARKSSNIPSPVRVIYSTCLELSGLVGKQSRVYRSAVRTRAASIFIACRYHLSQYGVIWRAIITDEPISGRRSACALYESYVLFSVRTESTLLDGTRGAPLDDGGGDWWGWLTGWLTGWLEAETRLSEVNPDPQIQSKLGNYSLVKHLLDKPKRLFGIEQSGIPQSPAPSPTPSAHKSGTDSSGRSCSPSSGPEFKKPGGLRGTSAASSSSSANHQRGGFVKPADGKLPYGGRGSYPGQPVKHGGNDHRNHGLLPAKGPPLPQPPSTGGSNGTVPIGNSSGSVAGNPGGSLSSRTQFACRLKLIEVNGSNSRASIDTPDVENILKLTRDRKYFPKHQQQKLQSRRKQATAVCAR
ncbi:hypothetical protein ALC60_04226 [Trachymyrmex zeteki]|uniref:Uncharacterized protein n=1 Tax=Mycetomoellerius zeteki TaxID=64791 RepID=A0A151X922_9HYME|nr:hypothetical protein ALC60_04226 [Trachymyrmex zeteki]